VALQRGFKTDANWISAGIREELGLSLTAKMDVPRLADYLSVPVERLSDMAGVQPGFAHHLGVVDPEAFSAVTVFNGSRRKIIFNDAHAPGRCTSNIAHELSHALLLHPPTPPLDDRGCRIWNEDIEDEANWLAGVLLVTEDLALALVRRGTSLSLAASELGVSQQMLQWRINATGARKRVERTRSFKARRSA
jgi:Zn-dependent peptidase ImmA (M78 family)